MNREGRGGGPKRRTGWRSRSSNNQRTTEGSRNLNNTANHNGEQAGSSRFQWNGRSSSADGIQRANVVNPSSNYRIPDGGDQNNDPNHDGRGRSNFQPHERRINPRGGFRGRNPANMQANSNNVMSRRQMSFKFVEGLLELQPEDICLKLDGNTGFAALLDGDISKDLLIIVVKILAKITECNFESAKMSLLQKLLKQPFVDKVTNFVNGLAIQTPQEQRGNLYFWRDTDAFWNDIKAICSTVLERIPNIGVEILPKLIKTIRLQIPLIEIEKSIHISDSIKNDILMLIDLVDEFTKEPLKPEENRYDEGEPPDDFRALSVYPTVAEIINPHVNFLRKNIIEGPYRSIDHYLDVQFRLLREDFVGPLREGVVEYMSKSNKKLQHVKVHRKIQFLHPVAVSEQHCVKLKFNFAQKKQNFKYENSRSFMYGSLLTFTNDNFQTVLFGKIADRDQKLLQAGELVVGFDENQPIDYGVDYTMIECNVYFEPYYQVLSVMQTMKEDDFPMEKYIIQANSSSGSPSYLQGDVRYTIGHKQYSPLYWPPGENFYGFNEAQNVAFKAALTQEFCIIQGPPGTGKTFLGLRIAETLLRNHTAWYNKTPILVICYTNHALDQFLEGIIPITERILRIGGQSKNEKLEKYNLRTKGRKVGQALYHNKNVVQNYLSEIRIVTETMNMIKRYDSIVRFSSFAKSVEEYRNSWFSTAEDIEIIDWLLSERQHMVQNPQRNVNQAVEGAENGESSDSEGEVEDENKERNIDDIFDEDVRCTSTPLLSLSIMREEVESNYERLNYFATLINEGQDEHIFSHDMTRARIYELENKIAYLRGILENAQIGVYDRLGNVDLAAPFRMTPQQRWRLYFHWLRIHMRYLMALYETRSAQFRQAYQTFDDTRQMEHIQLMRNSLLIGVTTTGAARLHASLKSVKSPIVIVEEAAEVLEAHVITSLTRHCQHLILIGDHKQLRPSTSNYQLERYFNLGISLFERMILNKIHCFTLIIQHRMRPEIASLITPTIYPILHNHSTVKHRPNIFGIDKSLYFIDHTYPEESEVSGTSKKNLHEAQFLIRLSRHLILNGYKPEQITILAAYLGQMFELQKEKKKHKQLLDNMRIAVLDNYQGEESDIILLSLVRSNSAGKIGFLSIENRVCVALSRARNGFYMIGNMSLLSNNSELWVKVKTTLQNQTSIGPHLTLRCQVHPENKTNVKSADDFLPISEGGCSNICGKLLPCGHNCKRLCHILDRDHITSHCRELCNRPLCHNVEHLCQKMCYEECGPCNYPVQQTLKCGHEASLPCYRDVELYECIVNVLTLLPCQHTVLKPCHKNPAIFKCPQLCDARLELCGHACKRYCHIRDDPDHINYKCTKPCAKIRIGCLNPELDEHVCPKLCFEKCIPCELPIKKYRTVCTHVYILNCSINVDEMECEKPCTKRLPCGHNCKSRCCDPCGSCFIMVNKIVPDCNHKVKISCGEEPSRTICKQKCPRMLICGHQCKNKCNQPCDSVKCEEMVDCHIPAICGHIVKKVPCNMNAQFERGTQLNDEKMLKYCTAPCDKILDCGDEHKHRCTGSCGECFQGRLHKRCTAACGRILICNHECKTPCRETCKPCELRCTYKCKHSKCKKKCGEPCTECTENCSRSCKHQSCRKRCGQLCNIEPCTHPCEQLLQCGHPCVGFCGDPCPKLCRYCDREELTEIIFGTEDEEDARFVVLNDCNHIIESTGMEIWLEQDDNEIKAKVCPKCKTPIHTTDRYSHYTKIAMLDIIKVKKMSHGSSEDMKVKAHNLIKEILQLRGAAKLLGSEHIVEVLKALADMLKPERGGRRLHLNNMKLDNISIKWKLIKRIVDEFKKLDIRTDILEKVEGQLIFILQPVFKTNDSITTPEIEDINDEITRLIRNVQLEFIKTAPHFGDYIKSNVKIEEEVEILDKLIHSLSKYSKDEDDQVISRLNTLNKSVSANVLIRATEFEQIVKAVGLKKGHWYKCPNGHPYVIGECGGANQIGQCNECKAKIGGEHHTLLAGNRHAGEIDGSRHSAWSEEANMLNYDL